MKKLIYLLSLWFSVSIHAMQAQVVVEGHYDSISRVISVPIRFDTFKTQRFWVETNGLWPTASGVEVSIQKSASARIIVECDTTQLGPQYSLLSPSSIVLSKGKKGQFHFRNYVPAFDGTARNLAFIVRGVRNTKVDTLNLIFLYEDYDKASFKNNFWYYTGGGLLFLLVLGLLFGRRIKISMTQLWYRLKRKYFQSGRINKGEVVYEFIGRLLGKTTSGWSVVKARERETLLKALLDQYAKHWEAWRLFLKVGPEGEVKTVDSVQRLQAAGSAMESACARHRTDFTTRLHFLQRLLEMVRLKDDPKNFMQAIEIIKQQSKAEGIADGKKQNQEILTKKEAELKAKNEKIRLLQEQINEINTHFAEVIQELHLGGDTEDHRHFQSIFSLKDGGKQIRPNSTKHLKPLVANRVAVWKNIAMAWPTRYDHVRKLLQNLHDTLLPIAEDIHEISPFRPMVSSLLTGAESSPGIIDAYNLIHNEQEVYRILHIDNPTALHELPARVFYDKFLMPYFIKGILDPLNALYHYQFLKTSRHNLAKDMDHWGPSVAVVSRMYGSTSMVLRSSFDIILDESIHLGRTEFDTSTHRESTFPKINRIGNNHYASLTDHIDKNIIYDVVETGFASIELGVMRKTSVGVK